MEEAWQHPAVARTGGGCRRSTADRKGSADAEASAGGQPRRDRVADHPGVSRAGDRGGRRLLRSGPPLAARTGCRSCGAGGPGSGRQELPADRPDRRGGRRAGARGPGRLRRDDGAREPHARRVHRPRPRGRGADAGAGLRQTPARRKEECHGRAALHGYGSGRGAVSPWRRPPACARWRCAPAPTPPDRPPPAAPGSAATRGSGAG